MYLNTLDKNEMYLSIAEILETDSEIVREYILQSMHDIIDWHYSEHNINNMSIVELMQKCKCTTLKKIDSLTVNHITPRENIGIIWQEGLWVLPHALTRKTSLSDYLYSLGFEFGFDGQQITMKRYGEIVNIETLNFSNLQMRFGGKYSLRDFNVNGYLFVDKFELDSVIGWLGSPEILKSLANAYGERNIADNFAEKCLNYYVSFNVPLEKVDIEGFSDGLNENEKTKILVKYTLNALAHIEYRGKTYFSMYNPIIMLKRNYNVSGSDIQKIWSFGFEAGKLIPKDKR